jgi:hypothetical protein
MADFDIPIIYNNPKYELEVNKNWAARPILSAEDAAKKYLEDFLGLTGGSWDSGVKGFLKDLVNNQQSGEERAQEAFTNIIASLPEYYRHEGFLQTVDIRPLLRAAADYSDKNDMGLSDLINEYLLLPTSNKYREIIGAKIKADKAADEKVISEEDLKVEVDKLLDNESGWSPSKYVEAVDPTTIKEGQEFGFDPSITTSIEGQSYTEFLRAHATATIEDLMQYEESGAVASKEDAFMPQEFITNLTGEVSGVDWTGKKVTWNLQQAKEYIWNLDDKKIPDLQNSLRDAGYFDKLQMYPMEGQRDQATALAWDMFLADTLRNNQSPATRLKGASDDFARRMSAGLGNLFMDKENIQGAALSLGSQILDRGLTGEELATLTEAVRNWERESYKSKSTGQGIDGDVFSQIDIESRIGNYMRDTYQEEIVNNSMPENIAFLKSVFG